jgi:L-glutamine-phosphate cytidylyltransferase
MKAIILAAGQGTRLKKYTENLPKGMLEFLGKTIIKRQIEMLNKVGIDDVIVVKGFASDKIKYSGVKYYTNEDYSTTNMIESLLAAKEEFNDDFIVCYSDILFDESMLTQMINSSEDYAVAVDDNWEKYWMARYGKLDFDTESLIFDDNNNITSLGKENPSINEIDARYIGLLKFSKKGMSNIVNIMNKAHKEYLDQPWQQSGKCAKQAYMTDLLQAIIETGVNVKAERFSNGWVEFDTNEDYELACKWAKTGYIREFLKI